MYASPLLKTTKQPQIDIIGVRPKAKADGADTQCQCADCGSNDCGPNNPCGIEPLRIDMPTILDVIHADVT
jgi:hypothetical protein